MSENGTPEILDSEIEILRRLRPMLALRAVGSALVVAFVWGLHLRINFISLHLAMFITGVFVAVNYFSFFFIKRRWPAVAFAMLNGIFFIVLLSIGIHLTGGIRSPLVFGFIILIFIIDTVTGSIWVTVLVSVLCCVALDTLVVIHLFELAAAKPFFVSIRIFTSGEESPLRALVWLNMLYLSIGVLMGYLMNITSRVRKDLEQANREKTRLQGLIKTLVSRDVWEEAQETARTREEMVLTERTAERTILFADIVGFSTISERVSPEKLILLLNAHFQIMGEFIDKHGGDIDKFIGDAVMAVFPEPDGAVEAALAIQKAFSAARAEPRGRIPRLSVRIGVNTGQVVIGCMGTSERMDHTLIGDPVNTAQRLESLAKPGGVLISETTYRLLKRNRGRFRPVGPIKLKGKVKKIRAYSCIPRGLELKDE
jgi:class 3 adenylate cyclase